MTRLDRYDADLHNPDGTHRTTSRTADGSDVEQHQRRIADHLDRHRRRGEPTT